MAAPIHASAIESSLDTRLHHSVPVRQDNEPRRGAGRPRKDYEQRTTLFDSVQDLKTALKEAIDNASQNSEPERVSCAFTLSLVATIECLWPRGPAGSFKTSNGTTPGGDAPTRSVYELCNIVDQKERLKWQRAAGKGIQKAVEDLDGFKYCFNNNWTSKDDDGCRFSYNCLDSLENSDRLVNGFKRTTPARRRPEAGTRGVRKPTYDCRGHVAVKFSGVRQIIEVVYKHTALHKTVAERAPPPRKSNPRKPSFRNTPAGREYFAKLSAAMERAFLPEDYQSPSEDDHTFFENAPTAKSTSAPNSRPRPRIMSRPPNPDNPQEGHGSSKSPNQPPSATKHRTGGPNKKTTAGQANGKKSAAGKTKIAEDASLSLADLLRQQMAEFESPTSTTQPPPIQRPQPYPALDFASLPYATPSAMPPYSQPWAPAPFAMSPPVPKPWEMPRPPNGQHQQHIGSQPSTNRNKSPSPDPWFPTR